jgi:hypothetical protein
MWFLEIHDMAQGFRLVDNAWQSTLDDAIANEHRQLRIMCPFIQRSVVERLLRNRCPETLQVITRFNLSDFCDGVSSTIALRSLLDAGAHIRGVKHLHAKVYIFGNQRAIVTSANLTQAAMRTNHEVGFVTDDIDSVTECRRSFDQLWARAGDDLTMDRLSNWERDIIDARIMGLTFFPPLSLRDEGCELSKTLQVSSTMPLVADSQEAFVKFWGESSNRVTPTFAILKEVKLSGCHWACTYPNGKRLRQVQDGAVMYMGRLTCDPGDTKIFGRAVALSYVQGRDDATPEDIKKRLWKKQWSHYARVHHGEFVNGTMKNGVSLGEMMDALGSDSFVSTQQNARVGWGNTNPRKAYRQQPAVRLSIEGRSWVDQRLQQAFERHGMIPATALAKLDWAGTAPKEVINQSLFFLY